MIISMCGKASSGKDTTGYMLQGILDVHYGLDFNLKSYASTLKNKLMDEFDLTYDQVYGDKKELPDKRYVKDKVHVSGTGGQEFYSTYWTPRELLQYFGTEVYRKIDPNIWVRLLRKSLNSKDNYIITDARFPNEIDWAVKKGGIRLIIEREGSKALQGTNHDSEIALDKYSTENDYYVDNNGTLEDLNNVLRNDIVPQILNKMNTKEIGNG